MKRIISFLLIVLMLFSFASCNGGEETETSKKKVYDDTLPENGYVLEDILANLEQAGFEADDIVVRDKAQCEDAPEFADVRDACDGRILFYIEAYDPTGGFVFVYGMQKLEDLPKVKSIVAGTKMEEEILNKSYKNVIALGTKIRSIKSVFGDDAVALDGGYTGDMIVENLKNADFEDIELHKKSDIATSELFAEVRDRYDGDILFCVEAYSGITGDYIYIFGAPNTTSINELKSAGAIFGPANVSFKYSNVVVFASNEDDVFDALGSYDIEEDTGSGSGSGSASSISILDNPKEAILQNLEGAGFNKATLEKDESGTTYNYYNSMSSNKVDMVVVVNDASDTHIAIMRSKDDVKALVNAMKSMIEDLGGSNASIYYYSYGRAVAMGTNKEAIQAAFGNEWLKTTKH